MPRSTPPNPAHGLRLTGARDTGTALTPSASAGQMRPAPRRVTRSGAPRQHTTQPRTPARPTAKIAARNARSSAKLRLVGEPNTTARSVGAQPRRPAAIAGAADPRWVLAVRTAEALQGDVLPPEQRETLMQLGKAMGLTPFDCCLILAMMQDQARRGLVARDGLAAVETQLSMIPLPIARSFFKSLRVRPAEVGLLVAGILAMQIMLVWILLG